MTAMELLDYFNKVFGLEEWPKTFIVDHETYSNVVRYLLSTHERTQIYDDIWAVTIAVGPHGGIYFKNVELLIGKRQEH